MDRKEYKQAFDRERYERIELKVPKGMKSIIKSLANDKGMSVTMQIAERNREMISGITGNMHDGYDIIFKDGYSCHCRTKKDVRSCIIDHCTEKGG